MYKIFIFYTLISFVFANNFYKHSSSSVLELDSNNFSEIVLKTNQTSLIKFYVPWCGYCQDLKLEYEKVGKILEDIAIIGAINCDLNKNKELCSKYKIQSFPTILAFRPPKININKPNKNNYIHATESFNGERNSKNLIDFVTGRIKNYVLRIITEEKLNEFLNDSKTNRPKVILFTYKNKLNSLIKSISIDYLGSIDFAYFILKENKKSIFKKFDINLNENKSILYYFDLKNNIKEKFLYKELSKIKFAKFLIKFKNIKNDVNLVLKRFKLLKMIRNGEKIKDYKKLNIHEEL